MFDLDEAITAWRRQMLAAGIKTPVPLEELECHLREDVEAQMASGTDPQRAFESATRRIGPALELHGEFEKANPGEEMKKRLRGILIILALIFTEVGLLLPMIAKWRSLRHTATVLQICTDQLQGVCLAIGLPLSLVLPLLVGALVPRDAGNVLPIMVGAIAPRDAGNARRWLRTVWTGQILIGVGGLWIILLPQHPVVGLLFAIGSVALCAGKLRRELRPSAGLVN